MSTDKNNPTELKEVVIKPKKGEAILSVATKYIGTKEKPKNSNKTIFGEWAKYNGVAWCGLFLSKCYEEAGYPLPKIGFSFNGFAGCQTAHAYFVKNKWLTNTPTKGDIVLFDWNNDKRFDHTGIFSHWLNENEFVSIEGNTSIGNDSNGGEVMKRTRDKKFCVFASSK